MITQDIIYILDNKYNTRQEVVETYNILIEEIHSIETLTHDNIPILFKEAILQECDGDTLLIKESFDEIKNKFKTTELDEEMQDILNTYCYKEQICPSCGEDLKVKTNKQTSEYFGFNADEPLYNYFCSNGCI